MDECKQKYKNINCSKQNRTIQINVNKKYKKYELKQRNQNYKLK